MTKKEMLLGLVELATEAGRHDLVEQANHELELLARKAAAPRKPTAAQKEGLVIQGLITNKMVPGAGYSATEIAHAIGGGYSLSKVTAALTKLKDAGVVTRETVKRKAVYTLVEA